MSNTQTPRALVPLNMDSILRIIREAGYTAKVDGDYIIVYRSEDLAYVVSYNDVQLYITCDCSSANADIERMQKVAAEITKSVVMVKADATLDPESNCVNLELSIVTYCFYEADFARAFPIFVQILDRAMLMYIGECDDVGTDQTRRPHIYYPEYRWLPYFFKDVSSGEIPIKALTDEEWIRSTTKASIEEIVSEKQSGEWDAFKIVRVENFGEYKLIVYQFPEPKYVPEAKYGVVLLNATTLVIDYYTMEYANGQWAYCSTTTDRHNNYGSFETGELDDFIRWVLSDTKELVASTPFDDEEEQMPELTTIEASDLPQA